MASSVSIELDLEVVQDAIHAKVRPAVDEILSRYDLQKLIKEKLEQRAPSQIQAMTYMYARLSGYGENTPLIETLISNEIQKAAEGFVKAHIEKERPKIEAAFVKMLKGSSDKLARSFFRSLEGALDNDWSFTVATNVSPKEIEHNDYGSDD